MNTLLQKEASEIPSRSSSESEWSALPTATEYAAAARRRAFGFLTGGILLALIVASAFVGFGSIFVPLVVLLAFAVPTLLWRYPRLILYVVLVCLCLFETNLLGGANGYADSLTDRVPIFWNVNTIFQEYAKMDFKAVPLNLLEVVLLLAGVCSLLRSVYTNTANLRPGTLIWPISVYLVFVGIGWINGIATGGDFKLSLQEVRAQFYFGIAYLLTINIVRDRRQLLPLLWTIVLCIGFKGILYTFRRYVTLAGLPLPDQGVGSHEEAFFFDAYVCILLALLVCGTFSKLRWVMLAMLPFVSLGNLACNRRASTAAFIIIVPLLFAAAYQALPKRRVLVGVLALVSTIAFAGYYSAFKNSDSILAQPARAIHSQFAPDARDASSNAYRDAENADLMATIKSAPLGYGYGKPMLHVVPIADISSNYEWWDIMTHNQVLWVWMRVGTFGFLAFWMMISAILIAGSRLIRDTRIDMELKSVAIAGLLIVSSLMIFGLLDLQFSNFRDMLFAGFWSGLFAVLATMAAPSAVSRAPLKQSRSNLSGGDLSGGDVPRQSISPKTAWTRPEASFEEASFDSGGVLNFAVEGMLPNAVVEPTQTESPTAGMKRAPEMSRSLLVARNVAATLFSQLLSWGMTFGVTIYLTRYVGASGLGALTLAASIAGVFSIGMTLGTSTVLIRDIARDTTRTAELTLGALALRLPLGLLAIAAGWGVAWALGYSPSLRLMVVAAIAAMLIGMLNDALSSALRGLQEIPRQNAAAIADKAVLCLLTVLLIINHQPLWMIAGVGGLSALVALLINATAFKPYLANWKLPTAETMRGLARQGLPFLTTAIFIAIYGNCDAVLMSKLSRLDAIGWYGLAKRLGGTTLFLPVALTGAMLPALSRLYQEDRPAFDGAARRMFNFILICAVPFAAVLILAPDQIIVLVTKNNASFAGCDPVLRILGAGIILWFLSQAAATALIASDRQGAFSRVTAVSALLCVPVTGSLIFLTQRVLPIHNGAVGAVLGDVLIEGYMVTAYLRALPAGFLQWSNVSTLVRAVAAALPLVGLFYFVHDRSNLLLLLPGLLLYIPLCWVLGCLHPQDIQMIRQIWKGRVRTS